VVPPEVIKAYPPRGPLQQFRLASAQPLTCFRCGKGKKSKLHTVYAGDWDRRLCNGCYGELLSIYDVKAGTAPDDERADALAQILLDLYGREEPALHLDALIALPAITVFSPGLITRIPQGGSARD
jgi:hypothetical protein